MYYSRLRPSPINPDRKFEFDEQKSLKNKDKHGMNFEEAQRLWLDHKIVELPARPEGEPRWLVVGKVGEKHWSATITYRGDRVRIISVRRARNEEIAIYED